MIKETNHSGTVFQRGHENWRTGLHPDWDGCVVCKTKEHLRRCDLTWASSREYLIPSLVLSLLTPSMRPTEYACLMLANDNSILCRTQHQVLCVPTNRIQTPWCHHWYKFSQSLTHCDAHRGKTGWLWPHSKHIVINRVCDEIIRSKLYSVWRDFTNRCRVPQIWATYILL